MPRRTPSLHGLFPRALAGAVVAAAAGLLLAGGLAARQDEDATKPQPGKQRRRPVEQEDVKPPPRKVIRVDDEDNPPPAKKAPPAPRPPLDLGQASRQDRRPAVRVLAAKVAVPHDIVVFGSDRSQAVEPVKPYLGDAPALRRAAEKGRRIPMTYLDAEGAAATTNDVNPSTLRRVRHYEDLALDAVREFREEQKQLRPDDPRRLPPDERLAVEEGVLSAVVRFHQSALDRGVRDPNDDRWPDVETKVKGELFDVLLQRLKALTDNERWDEAFELTRRLARDYPDLQQQKQIAQPLADLLERALRRGVSGAEVSEAVRRMQQLQEQFPNNDALKPISESLKQQARALFDEVRKLAKNPKTRPEAVDLWKRAVAAAPADRELRSFGRQLLLQTTVLRVGVRELPTHLSPAWAATDAERRAVELLFEGLVKLTCDAAGNAHYDPGLAEGRPQVITLGRAVDLARNAFWADNEALGLANKPITSGDVYATLKMLQEHDKARATGRPWVWGELLDTAPPLSDPSRVVVKFKQGYVDPLSALTFKVMPQELPESAPADSEAFARNPVGSGPYLLNPDRKEDDHRPCVTFVANPAFAARASKLGQGLPHIQEIRFIKYTDPVAELKRGKDRLHLILDLSAKQAAELAGQQAALQVRVAPQPRLTRPNQRVYFLGVSPACQALRKPEARRALAHAINREVLLDDFFRAPKGGAGQLGRLHATLAAPYPVGAWPSLAAGAAAAGGAAAGGANGAGKAGLYDLLKARALADQVKGDFRGALRLIYPEGDPALDSAMKMLCEQVSEDLKEQGVKLTPKPLPPRDWREAVEGGGGSSYDLAYWQYDYPDETFWLKPLLAPFTTATNAFGEWGELGKLLQQIQDRRDFGAIQQWTRQLVAALDVQMPVVPLWQLDPLFALSDDVTVRPFDPNLVFTDVEQWTLKGQAAGNGGE
jgi:ABC-type transport system substrate-binding protein